MAHCPKIAALLLLLSCGAANAGYAQLAWPEGFSGGPGDWRFAPSANDMHFGKVAHQPNGLRLPVPGKLTTMPVSYRFAANAGRVAAGFVFMNPGIRFAAGVVTWLGLGKLIWDEVEKVWREQSDPAATGGMEYKVNHGAMTVWESSPAAACQDYAAYLTSTQGNAFTTFTFNSASGGYCSVSRRDSRYPNENIESGGGYLQRDGAQAPACPPGWTESPAGCLSPALTQPDFVDKLAPKPMPDSVPWELPSPSPLPVEQPVINPEPGPDPLQRPRFVPTGDPVRNPNYNPQAEPSPENQPFIQPGVRMQPSPTPAEPFRVDMQPVDRPTATPDPQEVTDEGPGQTNPGDKPKQDTPGLCDLYPEILACAKLDTPDAPDLPEKEKPSPAITPDSGWGADNASCPAPRMLTVQGQQIAIPYDIFCQYMSGLRPIIIAMAWLSAGFILIGARGGD